LSHLSQVRGLKSSAAGGATGGGAVAP